MQAFRSRSGRIPACAVTNAVMQIEVNRSLAPRMAAPPGRDCREFLREFKPGNRPIRMQIGDHVYLITDQLRTGAGIPATICAIQGSTVEVAVAVEFTDRTEVLKVGTWDILPSNLYTHAILNVVYQTYETIKHEHGSILNLTAEEIVAELIKGGLAPQTAQRCADLFDEVEWQNAQLPLRQWLRRIRDFYHKKL
jgi:hypothetical protein